MVLYATYLYSTPEKMGKPPIYVPFEKTTTAAEPPVLSPVHNRRDLKVNTVRGLDTNHDISDRNKSPMVNKIASD